MIRPTKKKFVRQVTALVDADPTYVSLVSAGANGSPFNVVKQENPNMGVKVKKRQAATAPAKKSPVLKNANNRVAKGKEALTEAKPATSAIVKFLYSKEEFATEAEVREHLAKSDFEGEVTITEEDDQFIATADDVDQARIAKSAEVEADTGVVAVIATMKAEGVESEEDEDDSEDEEGEDEDGDDSEDDSEEDDEADDEEEDEDEEEAEEEPAPVTKSKKTAPKKPAAKTTEKPAAPAKSKKAAFLEAAAAEADDEEEEAVEAKLQKFDFWNVYDTASSDFMTLLKAGCEDGLAPGFDDVMWTFGQSIRKTLAGDDEAGEPLRKNADDFVTVVIGMHDLFANIVNADMPTVAKADKAKADSLTKWAKSFGKELVAKAERAKAGATTIVKNEAGMDTEALKKMVAEAVAPLAEQVGSVAKTVDKISQRRQTSKGIDPADGTTSEGQAPTTQKKTEKETKVTDATTRLMKSVFAAPTR